MTCNGDLDHRSAQLFSSALSLLAGYTVPSSLLMARYDPVKECAQDRTGYVSRPLSFRAPGGLSRLRGIAKGSVEAVPPLASEMQT